MPLTSDAIKLSSRVPDIVKPLLFTATAMTVFVYVITPEVNFLAVIGVGFFFFQLMEFIWLAGITFPLRNIFTVMMGLQMLFGPYLSYYWFPTELLYNMRIPDGVYFAYALPGFLLFTVGLKLFSRYSSEYVNIEELKRTINFKRKIIYGLIAVGFVFTFFGVQQGSNLSFVFVLLASFKYVGVFLLVLTEKKFPVIPVALVYGLLLFQSVGGGMFHDLLTWGIFLGIVVALRYKVSFRIKLISVLLFAVLAFLIQTIKESYRSKVWGGGQEAGISSIEESFRDVDQEGGVLSANNISDNIVVRINQGWILSSVIENVPLNVDHTHGELTKKYLEAAFLPRFLAPEKMKAGDRETFMRYSGVKIAEGTSMGLGVFSDAYIEFGLSGGLVYLFFYGALFNLGIFVFHRSAKAGYPYLLLFMPLVFVYPIRPDCETQTILGHFFKASFLVWVFHRYMKNRLKLYLVKGRSR